MSFENAAVTKGIMVVWALTTIFTGVFDVKHYVHIQFIPHISRHHQYWRLITNLLAFSNSTDLFLSELLLYNVGIHVERQFGSIKYASFLFVSLLLASLLQFITVMLFHRVGINHIALGPAAAIFSILYQYTRIVPPVYIYRIFGMPLNNKSMNYVLALQLGISRPLGSIAVALIGILTGQIYRSDLAGLNTYRLPPTVIRLSMKYIEPLIGSIRPPRRSNRATPDNLRSNQRGDLTPQNEEVITTARTPGGFGADRPRGEEPQPTPSVMREWMDELTRRDRASVGLRVPSEAEITHLTSIFPSLDREVVIGALQRSPNIEAAAETLLTSQTG